MQPKICPEEPSPRIRGTLTFRGEASPFWFSVRRTPEGVLFPLGADRLAEAVYTWGGFELSTRRLA